MTTMTDSKLRPSLRQRMLAGETLLGSWINSGSPMIAELMAATGFDFLCVEVEHSAVDLPQTQHLFQVIHSGRPDCVAIMHLHGVDYAFVKRCLAACAALLAACKRHGVAPGIHVVPPVPGDVRGRLTEGYRFIALVSTSPC